jgi:hypothetical protein
MRQRGEGQYRKSSSISTRWLVQPRAYHEIYRRSNTTAPSI